ncbi:hypothetical protein GGI42DRAFT_311388 [Trichoderma sp. SZMC 28013]
MSSSGQTNQQTMDDSVQKKLAEEQRINNPIAMRMLAEDLRRFQFMEEVRFVAMPLWRKWERTGVNWAVFGKGVRPPESPKK